MCSPTDVHAHFMVSNFWDSGTSPTWSLNRHTIAYHFMIIIVDTEWSYKATIILLGQSDCQIVLPLRRSHTCLHVLALPSFGRTPWTAMTTQHPSIKMVNSAAQLTDNQLLLPSKHKTSHIWSAASFTASCSCFCLRNDVRKHTPCTDIIITCSLFYGAKILQWWALQK